MIPKRRNVLINDGLFTLIRIVYYHHILVLINDMNTAVVISSF